VEASHAAGKQMQQEVERDWNRQIRDQKQKMKKLFSKMGSEDKEAAEQAKAERAQARLRCAVRWTSDDVDSDAYERGDTPACDGLGPRAHADHAVVPGAARRRGESNCLPDGQDHERASLWFLGASSSCELRWLKPPELMERGCLG
ncbi:unnamed protein product, partial [Prorocentrum cordatum]